MCMRDGAQDPSGKCTHCAGFANLDAVLSSLGDTNDEAVASGLRPAMPAPVAVHPIKEVGTDLCGDAGHTQSLISHVRTPPPSLLLHTRSV